MTINRVPTWACDDYSKAQTQLGALFHQACKIYVNKNAYLYTITGHSLLCVQLVKMRGGCSFVDIGVIVDTFFS
jgi:hypothetical protein